MTDLDDRFDNIDEKENYTFNDLVDEYDYVAATPVVVLLNLVVTFFVYAITSGFLQFGGLTGELQSGIAVLISSIAYMALNFVVLDKIYDLHDELGTKKYVAYSLGVFVFTPFMFVFMMPSAAILVTRDIYSS